EGLVLDESGGPASPLEQEQMLALARRARERCAPAPRGRLLRFGKLPLLGIGVVVASSAAAAAVAGFPQLVALVTPAAPPAELRPSSSGGAHPFARKQT